MNKGLAASRRLTLYHHLLSTPWDSDFTVSLLTSILGTQYANAYRIAIDHKRITIIPKFLYLNINGRVSALVQYAAIRSCIRLVKAYQLQCKDRRPYHCAQVNHFVAVARLALPNHMPVIPSALCIVLTCLSSCYPVVILFPKSRCDNPKCILINYTHIHYQKSSCSPRFSSSFSSRQSTFHLNKLGSETDS
jgi:hypothetical protein